MEKHGSNVEPIPVNTPNGLRWIATEECEHESIIPANGYGAYCKHCGETLE